MRNRVFAIGSRLVILCLALLSLVLVSCGGGTPSPSATGSATVVSATGSTATIEATTTTTGTLVLVRSIAGICPSLMNDSDVVRMYGPGLAVGFEGGPKVSRYYVDQAHTLTLQVGTHTDDTVVLVKLSEGVSLPAGITVDDHPEVVALSLSAPVTINQDIALGMPATKVVGLLGQPKFDETTGLVRKLIYEVVAEKPAEVGWVNYNATYLFQRDQLRSVGIYAGE